MEEFPAKVVESLTPSEAVGVVELLYYALNARILEELEVLLKVMKRVFGFTHILGGLVYVGDLDVSNILEWKASKKRFRLLQIGFPEEWLQEYCTGLYYRHDKVMRLLLNGHFASTWDDLYSNCALASQRVVFDWTKGYGLYPGLSVGCTCKSSGWGSYISCAGCLEGDEKRLLPIIDYIHQLIHGRLSEIIAWEMRQDELPATSRQKEIAYWICEGKTYAEIACIVGITERTVRYHVRVLFEKFGVNNRSLLVKEVLNSLWINSEKR